MPRIATVEIEHKKSGRTRIVNKKDFDPKGADKDWTIVESRSREAMQESDDKPSSTPAAEAAPDAPQDIDEPDWRKMKWPQARQFIKSLTGEAPKSKAHAEELMSA